MALEQEDEDLQLATAISLSLGGGGAGHMSEGEDIERALAQSLMGSDPASLRHETPDFLTVNAIAPNGWCFYDCVLQHLRLNQGVGETDGRGSRLP